MKIRLDFQQLLLSTIVAETKNFVDDLFSTLRERMLDLRTGKTVFVGGGSILLKPYIESSGKVGVYW